MSDNVVSGFSRSEARSRRDLDFHAQRLFAKRTRPEKQKAFRLKPLTTLKGGRQ